MCITFFYINREPNARIRFAMVHNREENFLRGTKPLGPFEEDPYVFGGRDIQQKGTWLGFNAKTQNLAFLTNRFSWPNYLRDVFARYRSSSSSATLTGLPEISRGKLIEEFVKTSFGSKVDSTISSENSSSNPPNVATTAAENISQKEESLPNLYASLVRANKSRFRPFNLLLGNLKEMEFVFYSNFDSFPAISLRDGFHTLCNHASFDEPIPKQVAGLEAFKQAVQKSISATISFQKEDLTEIKALSTNIVAEKQLVQDIHELMENKQSYFTPKLLPIHKESSIFINPYQSFLKPEVIHGTLTSTVILFNDRNELTISENTYHLNPETNPKTNITYQLQL